MIVHPKQKHSFPLYGTPQQNTPATGVGVGVTGVGVGVGVGVTGVGVGVGVGVGGQKELQSINSP